MKSSLSDFLRIAFAFVSIVSVSSLAMNVDLSHVQKNLGKGQLVLKDSPFREACLFWKKDEELIPAEHDLKPYYRKFFKGPDRGIILEVWSDGKYLIVVTALNAVISIDGADAFYQKKILANQDNFKIIYKNQ